MKKICILFVFILALVGLASCDSNTPHAVADKAMAASKNQDFDQIVELMGDKNGDALNEEQKDGLKTMFKEKVGKNGVDQIKSFTMKEEKISDDGKKAVVKYDVVYDDGQNKETTVELKQGSDGVWRLSSGK